MKIVALCVFAIAIASAVGVKVVGGPLGGALRHYDKCVKDRLDWCDLIYDEFKPSERSRCGKLGRYDCQCSPGIGTEHVCARAAYCESEGITSSQKCYRTLCAKKWARCGQKADEIFGDEAVPMEKDEFLSGCGIFFALEAAFTC